MSKVDFWKQAEITESNLVWEDRDYLVVVTPTLWRQLARSDTDRNLGEFCIVNKQYGTVESTANNLPLAISTAKTLQGAVLLIEKEGKPRNVEALRIVPKDPSE